MSTKGNKELVRQLVTAWNACGGNAAKIRSWSEKYYSPTLINHNLLSGDLNWEQATQMMVQVSAASPDVRYSIDELVAEGDKVVNRYTMEGTHNGSYMGIPATGKRFVVKGVEINRIADREIVEVGVFPDIIGMMTQLGVVHGATPKT